MPSLAFPDGFVWGTATAAHQVEGGNWNNDWWAWEHMPDTPCVEPSADACDHYHRYPDDVRLLASLGFTAYRFSLEWSRVEPEEGHFSRAALDHYRRMCASRARPRADRHLHHFTTPRWVRRARLDGAGDRRLSRACARAARIGDVVARDIR
jgi:beta-glucosidase